MSTRADLLNSLACSIDPIAFAQALGIDPDEWQRDLLLSEENQIILNCARQSGKSEITAILALHHALNCPGSLILVLSPSLRQSSELFKKILAHWHTLNKPLAATIESALTLQLANKSRIVSLPATEKTIRGFSGASLLIIDEAARVEDDLYIAVRPMLAVSGGRLILLSTPAGKRGFYYHEWTEGPDTKWKKIRITADQVPRIPPDSLDEDRRALGNRLFEQEYFCAFHERDDQVFDTDLVRAAIKNYDEWDLDLDDDIPELDITKFAEFESAEEDAEKDIEKDAERAMQIRSIQAWELGV